MRKLLGLMALCVATGLAFGQGGSQTGEILKSTSGQAGTVRVCTSVATGTPCSPLATIYSDAALTTPIVGSIVTSDINGNYSYYAAPGNYKEQFSSGLTRVITVAPDVNNASFKRSNNTRYADQFSGANGGAKISAAIADLPATGGIVYATGFGNTTQTISSAIQVGAADKPVRLLIDTSQTRWNITATGGIDVFQIADGSTLEFTNNNIAYSTGASNMPAIHVSSGASIQAVIAPLSRTGTQNTVRVQGGTIVVDSGATVSAAVIDLQGLFLNTVVRDVNVLLQAGTIGLYIRPGTGPGLKVVSDLLIDNVQVNGLNTSGARPLVISTAASSQTANITFLAGGFQHAGSAQYEIEIDGGANTANGLSGIFFYGHHLETKTGSLGVKVRDARNVNFIGGTVSESGAIPAIFALSESTGSGLTAVSLIGISDAGGGTPTNWVSNSAGSGSNVAFVAGATLNYTFKVPEVRTARTVTASDIITGAQLFVADADASIPLALRWFSASQSGDLLQAQNNTGFVISRIDKSGNFHATSGNYYGASDSQMALTNTSVAFTTSAGAALKGQFGTLEINNVFGTAPPSNGAYIKGQAKIDGGVDISGGTAGLKIKDQGTCTMSSGACSAQSLGHTYASAPNCFVNWNATGTLTGILKAPSTTTTVTPASSVGTDTAVVNWFCLGN